MDRKPLLQPYPIGTELVYQGPECTYTLQSGLATLKKGDRRKVITTHEGCRGTLETRDVTDEDDAEVVIVTDETLDGRSVVEAFPGVRHAVFPEGSTRFAPYWVKP